MAPSADAAAALLRAVEAADARELVALAARHVRARAVAGRGRPAG